MNTPARHLDTGRAPVAHPRASRSDLAAGAIEVCARFGYAAKGLVFGTVGVLAVMTVLGFAGGRIVGTEGAVQTLGNNPYGQATLVGIAIGLIAYVIWRLVQAFFDAERKGTDAKGWMMRIGFLISGLAYASLALFTLRHLQGTENADSGGGSQEATSTLLSHDWGVWLVAGTGVGFIGVGLYQFYRAYTAKFRDNWRRAQMGVDEERWAVRLSRLGIAARATSFVLIGGFLLEAAVTANPAEAEGLRGALTAFISEPWGEAWLALIGLGFICYGIYCFVNARYRHIPVD